MGWGQRPRARCAPLPGQVMKTTSALPAAGKSIPLLERALLGSGIAWQCLPPKDGALSPANRADARTQTPPLEPSLPAAASVAIPAPAVEPGALLLVAHKERAFFHRAASQK